LNVLPVFTFTWSFIISSLTCQCVQKKKKFLFILLNCGFDVIWLEFFMSSLCLLITGNVCKQFSSGLGPKCCCFP
jgi:hypothetical protein